jgi:hypothetical protein
MTMRTQVSVLKKKVNKLEKDIQRIKDVVGLLPPLIKPLEWRELYDLDRKVLAYMIENENQISFRTGEIAEALGLPKDSGRVMVWKSLKRIRRVGRTKHACILEQDKVAKTWSLRHSDFTFR